MALPADVVMVAHWYPAGAAGGVPLAGKVVGPLYPGTVAEYPGMEVLLLTPSDCNDGAPTHVQED
jgi:hypothetical protein